MLAVASILCALTVSFNFYGAVALALMFAIMVWTLWVVYDDLAIWWRAAGIVALAYALTAWWLTPTFLALTAKNLKLVAQPASAPSWLVVTGLILCFGVFSRRLGRSHPERAWPVFLTGAVSIFGLSAIGGYYFHFHALGEPRRLVPEFDLLLIVGAVESLRTRWRPAAAAGGLLLAASLVIAIPYLRHPWRVYVADHHPELRIEYQLADWLATNLPGARVHTAGSLGFWSGAWRNVPQVGGVSDQGMENQLIAVANWQITVGHRPSRDVYWLQALGASAIVVHGRSSQEPFHAIRDTDKFRDRLPILYDSGQGDIVYGVSRRFPALARVVDRGRLQSLRPVPWTDLDEPELREYTDVLETGPNVRPEMRWTDSRSIHIHAPIVASQSVVIQETYDSGWRAWTENGREVPIDRDVLGFMRIDPPSGTHDLYLHFDTPLEERIGSLLTAVGLVIVLLCVSTVNLIQRHRPPHHS
jgi:hypothetical protein